MDKHELRAKLDKALTLMNKKQKVENESIIDSFIRKYEDVLNEVDSKDNINYVDFTEILSCTRAYAETSSDYQQDFLVALGEVEKYIKN